VIFLAMAGEDHGRSAPRLGYPAHGPISIRQHRRARQSPAVGHDAFDHQDGAPLGAVVEHLLTHDLRREVAQRGRHFTVPGLLAPGDHAVGHEVRSGRDSRVGCCGCRPALDHPETRAPQLALEIPHANAGLLQLGEDALILGWVVFSDRGEPGQRLAFEWSAPVRSCPVDDLTQGGFDIGPVRRGTSVCVIRLAPITG
jgi:hypothetical protein